MCLNQCKNDMENFTLNLHFILGMAITIMQTLYHARKGHHRSITQQHKTTTVPIDACQSDGGGRQGRVMLCLLTVTRVGYHSSVTHTAESILITGQRVQIVILALQSCISSPILQRCNKVETWHQLHLLSCKKQTVLESCKGSWLSASILQICRLLEILHVVLRLGSGHAPCCNRLTTRHFPMSVHSAGDFAEAELP